MRTNKAPVIGVAVALATIVAIPALTPAQDESPAMEEAASAKVRLGHFSPDAPNVDVYANGGAILEDVPFGTLSDYLDVPGGTYAIEVVAAGADPADGAVIGPVDLELAAGTRTTVPATNDLESIEAQVASSTSAPTLPLSTSPPTVATSSSKTWPIRRPPTTSTSPKARTTSSSALRAPRTWPSISTR